MEGLGKSNPYKHPAHIPCGQQEIVGPSFNQVLLYIDKTKRVAASLGEYLTSTPRTKVRLLCKQTKNSLWSFWVSSSLTFVKGFLKAIPEKEVSVQMIYRGSAPGRPL